MNDVTGEFLDELRRMSTETEWPEFKRAGQTFNFDQMAQYVSALANEANLHRREEGWLVMGIDDRLDPATGMRPAIGTEFARSLPELNRIREWPGQTERHRGCCCGVFLLRPEGCRSLARATTGGEMARSCVGCPCTSSIPCARNRLCTTGQRRS